MACRSYDFSDVKLTTVKISLLVVIVKKINQFVEDYANFYKCTEYLFNTWYKADTSTPADITVQYFHVTKIDYARLWSDKNANVFNSDMFSKIQLGSPTCTQDIINNTSTKWKFMRDNANMFLPDYLIIDDFLTKLLFSYPSEITNNDFKEINKIYIKFKNESKIV